MENCSSLPSRAERLGTIGITILAEFYDTFIIIYCKICSAVLEDISISAGCLTACHSLFCSVIPHFPSSFCTYSVVTELHIFSELLKLGS